MADDNKNENQDQDDFFGDDDDFGLPDLEYEALGDDDGGGAKEEPAPEAAAEPEPTPEPEPEPTPEPEPQPEAEAPVEDSIFGEESFDDAGDTGVGDAAAESTDDSSGDASSEFGDDIYAEEDFGDFDAGDIDLDEELSDSVFDSDDFGGDEFKDFETEGAGDTAAEAASDFQTTPTFSADDAQGSKGKFTRIVVFGTILFVGLGLVFYIFFAPGDEAPKEVARKEAPKKAPAKRPAAKKPAEKAEASNDQQQRPQQQRPANTASRPQQQRPAATQPAVAATPGSVNRLDSRTGNAWVVVASFVDEDIAMDYANKLAGEGKSPTIIPPFGNGLFNRVAIAGFPTVAAAQQGIDPFKSEYGQDVWILKY